MLLRTNLLKSGSIAHDVSHPLFELGILSVMLVEHAVLHSFSVGIDRKELGERIDFVSASEISNSCPVDLNKSDSLLSIPRNHILQDLVEIIEAIITVWAMLHVCVHENVFVLVFSLNQREIFIVVLNWLGLALLPPALREISSSLYETGDHKDAKDGYNLYPPRSSLRDRTAVYSRKS